MDTDSDDTMSVDIEIDNYMTNDADIEIDNNIIIDLVKLHLLININYQEAMNSLTKSFPTLQYNQLFITNFPIYWKLYTKHQ